VLRVCCGALLMFGGATALAIASSSQASSGNALRGVLAALAAGAMWGTMYIPYRKAYLTGMNPLSFITFFTVGELVMMSILAISLSGGVTPLVHQLSAARHVLFWLLAGGVVWVVGDLFQQYAVKYAGITRGIPLSNTNQLWGLLWGVLVFGELRGGTHDVLVRVIIGSVVMALGAGVIALSSVSGAEHEESGGENDHRDPELHVAEDEGEPAIDVRHGGHVQEVATARPGACEVADPEYASAALTVKAA
jgi:drug/metabolite transporter (DMT)-like permease